MQEIKIVHETKTSDGTKVIAILIFVVMPMLAMCGMCGGAV